MKNHKYLFVAILLAGITLISTAITKIYLMTEDQKAPEDVHTVVTSFYPMYIAAANVIGDCEGVKLENLSEPQTGCLHDYQLTPEDMKTLSTADLFIVNGGGIESFLSDVAKQYPQLVIQEATEGIDLIEGNAHAWMDLNAYEAQVRNIEHAIEKLDPENGTLYQKNADAYCAKIQKLQQEAKEIRDKIEPGTKVILFHEAYEYVAEEYGVEVAGILDLDEERQVSAGEVAKVMKQIREDQVHVIFAEELYGKDMGDTMEKETDVSVYYLDTLVRGNYDQDSYLEGMRQNLKWIKEALTNEEDH